MAEREYPIPRDMFERQWVTFWLREAGYEVREGNLDRYLIRAVMTIHRTMSAAAGRERPADELIDEAVQNAVRWLEPGEALRSFGCLRPELQQNGGLRRYRPVARAVLARELRGVARPILDFVRFGAELEP